MQEISTDIFDTIENKIFTIRGVPVMLDSDLALLYGVETKRINEAAKRNIDRFPGWFMFQLTQTEWQELKNRKDYQYSISDLNDVLRSQIATLNEKKDVLRSQIATSSLEYGGRRYLPFAFTEQNSPPFKPWANHYFFISSLFSVVFPLEFFPGENNLQKIKY